ncbi:metal-dependent hydrolase [Stenotrophomonas sp. HITSZ_GD]|uniref:metal-dependent hydrolase n=1 Tax=Stenotrophomonas sp. HITSZ_GD TaxID=3037248 RepID=UPI00240DC09D|nr:metal-dependent hydrolase [Stenotrophomonas sp. HITSZ_GD]MDG2526307.1 metal-dependent hydrolase [Stenotrophomonas sp. HITSZ_GD]
MDSLTQIVLGGAVAAAVAPASHRRAALLAGAALGTLPDLDSLVLWAASDNPVTLMTVHRSFSHSLFVLPLLGALIWTLFRHFGHGRVAQAPRRWFWAIQLALVTHPLLDAFTVYGTQLWWPLHPHPTMWSSVFIIDPLYTVWLAMACAIAWCVPARPLAQRALVAGLALSSAYLGWSLLAKHLVQREADRALAAMGLADAPRFSVPMPFNTLLWRVVAMTPNGYVIGERSLVADRGPMQFEGHPSQVQALAETAALPAVQRLNWFNRGFMRAQVVDSELVLSDLRMGLEPEYNFNFVVARQGAGGRWEEIAPRQLQAAYRAPVRRGQLRQALARMWTRIWQASPPAPAQ